MSRICVFCGSSPGVDPRHRRAAQALGTLIAERGLGLVYGGGGVGLMGVLADAALAAGGEVIGVIPGPLASKEVAHPGVTTMHVVSTMHERKALMGSLSDGFIAMPGGFGTYEELFETITWAQLGIHRKSIGLLNVAAYFDPLLALIDNGVAAGFIRPQYRRLVVAAPEPADLLSAMASHELPETRVWIRPEQS